MIRGQSGIEHSSDMSGPHKASSLKAPGPSSVTETELPAIATEKTVDLTLRFLNENKHLVEPPTAEDEAKLKKKLYLWVVLLALVIELVLYVSRLTSWSMRYTETQLSQIDKSTLSYASILGLFKETGISSSQYNNVNTMFYVGAHYHLEPSARFILTSVQAILWLSGLQPTLYSVYRLAKSSQRSYSPGL